MEPTTKTVNGVVFHLSGRQWQCSAANSITIHDTSFTKEPRWGVNWAGCGTLTPAVTKVYAERMLAAAALAEELNSQGK